jgi:hypothetical protein
MIVMGGPFKHACYPRPPVVGPFAHAWKPT